MANEHEPAVVREVRSGQRTDDTTGDGIEVIVHVRPGGHRDAIEGYFNGALAVRVAASPTNGQANVAVERTMATALDVRPSAVSVIGGATSRRKKVLVRGDRRTLMAAVQVLLGAGR